MKIMVFNEYLKFVMIKKKYCFFSIKKFILFFLIFSKKKTADNKMSDSTKIVFIIGTM